MNQIPGFMQRLKWSRTTTTFRQENNAVSEQKIHECLQVLRDELNQLQGDNQQVQERVSGLIAEVEQQLLKNEHQHQNPSLMESINKTIELYKVEHPGVTGILNQIMMSLGNMGV